MLLDSSPSQALDHAGRTPPSCPSLFRLDEQHITLPLDGNESHQPFQQRRGDQYSFFGLP
jgi:hypothetical protein